MAASKLRRSAPSPLQEAPGLIPLSQPRIEGNAWKYVKDCLDTEWVSSAGSYVESFEESVRAYTDAGHAVAGVNGTACLHAALEALGVGPGDGVIVPALTFIATANAVSYCGARPVFLDCDPVRFNLDLDLLERFLGEDCARRGGRLVTRRGSIPLKAVLPAHVLGFPADMTRLTAIARRYGLLLVEDAAESVGSFWEGRHTGTFGAAGILSFNGNKIVTCGGGGMVLTGDKTLARRLRHITRQAKADPREYLHDQIGYNYRLTNVAAALGLSQMELLPSFLAKRGRISSWYRERLQNVFVEPKPPQASWNRWLLSAQAASPREKERLLKKLNAAGCQSRSLWMPLPRQKPYREALSTPIPNAEKAYATLINIPSSTRLSEQEVERVCAVLGRGRLSRLLV